MLLLGLDDVGTRDAWRPVQLGGSGRAERNRGPSEFHVDLENVAVVKLLVF